MTFVDDDWVSATVAMLEAAEEDWRRDADEQGFISGRKRHCMLAATVLAAITGSMQANQKVDRLDLLTIAEQILGHQNDEIDAFEARIQAEVSSVDDASQKGEVDE